MNMLWYFYFLGAVELENLPLKKDALKELELPFEVKAGMWNKGVGGSFESFIDWDVKTESP